MDGRIQLPVIKWITENHDLDYVDMITEPGMDQFLADEENSLDSLIAKIRISIEKNNSNRLFVVAHHDCRGNPVSDNEHKKQLGRAVQRIEGLGLDMEILGLWINDRGECEKF